MVAMPPLWMFRIPRTVWRKGSVKRRLGYTSKKPVPKAKKKRLRKIAARSRRINRGRR